MTASLEQPGAPAFHQLDVGVIGAGRVGPVLGNALRAAGHRVVAVAARSAASRERAELLLPGVAIEPAEAVAQRSDLVVIAVPDDQLALLIQQLAGAGAWRTGQLVLHTAGRYGLGVLQPAAEAGALTMALHPAMTFSGTSLDLGRLAGAHYAITAAPMLLPLAQVLVSELEGVPVVIGEADRALYHAALSHAANHLVTLQDQAMRLLADVGVSDPGAMLEPLVSTALMRTLHGGVEALTGPASRGDVETISAHLRALHELDLARPGATSDTIRAYSELCRDTAAVAERLGRITEGQRAAIGEVLASADGAATEEMDER